MLEVIPTRRLRTGAVVPQYVEAPLRIKPPDHLFLTPQEAVEEEDYRLQLYSDISTRLEQALVVLEAQVMRRRRELHGHVEARPMEGVLPEHRWGQQGKPDDPITFPGVPFPPPTPTGDKEADDYRAKLQEQEYQSRYQAAAFAQALADDKNHRSEEYPSEFKLKLSKKGSEDEEGKVQRGLVGGLVHWLLGGWEGPGSDSEAAAIAALEASRAAASGSPRSPIASAIRATFGGAKKQGGAEGATTELK